MRLEDLNWMAVEKYLQQDDRLMLVTGATEQHAYLSLLTDIKIPLALADAASQASGVLVAPPLNFGLSPYFLAYPGTLSLRVSTLCSAVEDIVRSAHGYSFKRILVVNGHGGNSPVRNYLQEVNNTLPDLKLNWYDWWLSDSTQAIAKQHGLKPSHANWLEAFPFTTLGEMPDGVKPFPKVPSAIMDARTTRSVYGDGSFGGPYRAPDEVMDEIFAACVKDIVQLLAFE